MMSAALKVAEFSAFSAEWYVAEMLATVGAIVVALLEDGRFVGLSEVYPNGMRISDETRFLSARASLRDSDGGAAAVAAYCMRTGRVFDLPGTRPKDVQDRRGP